MLRWLELLTYCYNVAEKRTPRATFGYSNARLNVALTLTAARCGVPYSLIEWKLF